MSDRVRTLRNVGILVGLAVVVWLVPGGAETGSGISNLLSVLLAAGFAFFAYRLYMEHRMTLMDLPDDQRRLLYGSVTLLLVAFLCTGRLWRDSGPLILLWFVLIGVAAAGLVRVYRLRTEY